MGGSIPQPPPPALVDDVPVRYRDVHGYRRAFRMLGSGPPLLLIHGIGDSSATWLPVLGELARHYTVVAPDLLGHGGSAHPRADYAVAAYACGMRDLLGVLDIDRATVVGHSLGGGVAMQFAYQFPERCERLVLVGTAGVGRDVHPLLRLAAGPGAEFALPLATAAPVRAAVRAVAPVLRTLGRIGGGRTGWGPMGWTSLGLGADLEYVLARYTTLADTTARQAFLRTLRAGVDARGQVITMLDRSYLAAGLPTLILWGARDRVIPVAHARTANAAMPGSRLLVFPDSGHFPHHDDPAGFVKAVEEFVSGTEAARHDADRWRTLLRAGRPPAYAPGEPPQSSGA
ncbi:alpha/beta fold hydrolase [Yinghuangia seranimata]|uniref:alpha/beta fold hydrolase n=1 Tax=Yinghuangia seranimata TaxID=408067 RepID=UPI00248B63EB|nr:alpha/beta hydrolase [Yinghuangia seranimata]MDI2126081.1 alpha/beta hydrolase [Yinghuangia seranimata]